MCRMGQSTSAHGGFGNVSDSGVGRQQGISDVFNPSQGGISVGADRDR